MGSEGWGWSESALKNGAENMLLDTLPTPPAIIERANLHGGLVVLA
jgi:hypothetical protein